MKKKVLAFALACCTTFCTNIYAAPALNLTINGNAVQTDTPPVNIDGRILVPMRAMFEALGADVEWDSNTQTATAVKDKTTIKLTAGSSTAYVNGTAYTLDVPAQIINGRVMVPSRFIGENLNYNVGWNNGTQTVELNSYQNAYEHTDAGAHGISGVPDGWLKIDGSPEAMIKAIANGEVVYVNGQCYASPSYVNKMTNENVVSVVDVAKDKPSSVATPNQPMTQEQIDAALQEAKIETEKQKQKEAEERNQLIEELARQTIERNQKIEEERRAEWFQ